MTQIDFSGMLMPRASWDEWYVFIAWAEKETGIEINGTDSLCIEIEDKLATIALLKWPGLLIALTVQNK